MGFGIQKYNFSHIANSNNNSWSGYKELNSLCKDHKSDLKWFDRNGTFVGGLSNPAPVTVLADGTLQVNLDSLWTDEG